MKCHICGMHANDLPAGVYLQRVNPKGEAGLFECYGSPDESAVVNAIEGSGSPRHPMTLPDMKHTPDVDLDNATSEPPDRASGERGTQMTDREMTKLCAQAMGYTIHEFPNGAISYADKYGWGAYTPLSDDAQAMELVKRFRLEIVQAYGAVGLYGAGPTGQWDVSLPSDNHAATADDLNRAIVECVAKMQRATPLPVGHDASSEPRQNETNAVVQDEPEGWVSVKERLPEEKKHRTSDVCLVTDGNDYAFRHFNFAANAWVGDYLFDRVTYWLSRPPLPRATELSVGQDAPTASKANNPDAKPV